MTGDHEGARAERQDPGSEDGNPGHAFEDCRDVKMSTDVAADYLRDKRDTESGLGVVRVFQHSFSV